MAHRHSPHFRRTAAATLAALALAASPAAARPALDPTHHDSVPAAPQAQAVEQPSDGGFAWGSAVIGAGAATAVCLLTGAGVTTAARRHHREPRTPSASAA
ncbi:MAG TPA: hypothetical protein VFN44_06420 [Solirubrobacteraceae bacterium]|nr:hypothetical protein [Solirubrobacteraceae bacterium]